MFTHRPLTNLKKVPQIFLILFSLLILSQQQSYSQTYCKTFKNTSAVGANDFHCSRNSGKIKNASAKPYFGDTVLTPPANSFDWPTSSNLQEVPMGGSMTVYVEGGEISGTSYFTRNGTQIGTKSVGNNTRYQASAANSGDIIFENNDPVETLIFSNVLLYSDNTGPLDAPNAPFTLNGIPVGGFPSTFSLSPGQTISFPYTFVNPNLALICTYECAEASNPTNIFQEGLAQRAGGVSIPTMSQWGLVIFGLLILCIGAIVIWKRRNKLASTRYA